jgi:chromosome segregation ATPase
MFKTLILTGVLALTGGVAHAEEFDLGVESDMAFADSESALAAEEEASRRAADEKLRAQQEREIAKREQKKARQLEAEATAKIAKWNEDEKRFNAEYKEANKRKVVAQGQMQKLNAQVAAREAELTALTQLVDQTVADRDKYEAAIEKTNERIQQIEAKFKAQTLRRARAEQDKTKLAKHYQERRNYLKALVRSPATTRVRITQQPREKLKPVQASAASAQ